MPRWHQPYLGLTEFPADLTTFELDFFFAFSPQADPHRHDPYPAWQDSLGNPALTKALLSRLRGRRNQGAWSEPNPKRSLWRGALSLVWIQDRISAWPSAPANYQLMSPKPSLESKLASAAFSQPS